MTMRMRLLVTREDAQAGVALAAALPEPRRERWKAERLDVAERRHERERGDREPAQAEEGCRAAPSAAATQGSEGDRRRGERPEDATDSTSDRLVEVVDEQSEQDTRGGRKDDTGHSSERRCVQQSGQQDADAGRESGRHADPVEVAEHGSSVGAGTPVSSCPQPGKVQLAVSDRAQPLLVFFCSVQSGPARRMESLLAHVARKERERVRVMRVDVDERPELAERFKVDVVPTLALVKDKRVVDRLEGRASAPAIERMLAPHLDDALAVA